MPALGSTTTEEELDRKRRLLSIRLRLLSLGSLTAGATFTCNFSINNCSNLSTLIWPKDSRTMGRHKGFVNGRASKSVHICPWVIIRRKSRLSKRSWLREKRICREWHRNNRDLKNQEPRTNNSGRVTLHLLFGPLVSFFPMTTAGYWGLAEIRHKQHSLKR